MIAVELPAVDFGVHGEEIVHIPDHGEFALDVGDVFVDEGEIFAAEEWAAEEEEAEGVGGVFVHEFVRVGEVAEGFGHFAAVVAGERAFDYDVFVGVLVEERRTNDMDVIKPSADLWHIFSDKVTGEVGFELLFVFEGVMELREGHRA